MAINLNKLKTYWTDAEEYQRVQKLHKCLVKAYRDAFGNLEGLYPVYNGWTMEPVLGVPIRKQGPHRCFDAYVDMLTLEEELRDFTPVRLSNRKEFLQAYLHGSLDNSRVDEQILRRSHFHRILSYGPLILEKGIEQATTRLEKQKEERSQKLSDFDACQEDPYNHPHRVERYDLSLKRLRHAQCQQDVLEFQLIWLELWQTGYKKWLSPIKAKRLINVAADNFRGLVTPEEVFQRRLEFDRDLTEHPDSLAKFQRDYHGVEDPVDVLLGRWWAVMLTLCGASPKDRREIRRSRSRYRTNAEVLKRMCYYEGKKPSKTLPLDA